MQTLMRRHGPAECNIHTVTFTLRTESRSPSVSGGFSLLKL